MSLPSFTAKVVLVGPTEVGKTCLARRGTADTFDPNHEATIGASYFTKHITTLDAEVILQIWDTAGQERYKAITSMYYRGAEVAVIVYSIDDEGTFKEADSWFQELQKYTEKPPLIFLVGNKCDLIDSRQVTAEMVEEYAEKINATTVETSAMTGQNVADLFHLIAEAVVDKQKQSKAVDDTECVEVTSIPSNQAPDKKTKCC